jgi:hypothetical protein
MDKQKQKVRQSLSQQVETVGTKAADQIAKVMDSVGEGKTVVVVVVPVVIGNMILARELDWEGGDTES